MGGPELKHLERCEEIDFANREIDRLIEMWKHVDQQSFSIGTPFIALAAASVPVLAVLSTALREPRNFYLASIPFLIILAISGMTVVTRYIVNLQFAYVCLLRADAMRRYFIDRSPELGQYMTFAKHSHDIHGYIEKIADSTTGRYLYFPMNAGCSCLVGLAAALAVWGPVESIPVGGLIGVGVIAAAASFRCGITFIAMRRRYFAAFLSDVIGSPPEADQQWRDLDSNA